MVRQYIRIYDESKRKILKYKQSNFRSRLNDVYDAIVLHSNYRTGKSRITNKGLANYLHANHDTITRSIEALKKIDVIRIEYKGRRIISLVDFMPIARASKKSTLPTKQDMNRESARSLELRSSPDPFNLV